MGLFGKIREYETNLKINKRGKIGEAKVDRKLNPLLFGKVEHRYIDNLMLVDSNNKTHQIDHIEIRQNGIFCIETKNIIGWVFGDEVQDKWTQVLYNGEKHQFNNPLKQNKSHVYHVSNVIGKRYHVNSVVVMVQNNADKIECDNVVNLDDLKHYLKKYDDGTELSLNAMDDIYKKLLLADSKISTKEHIQNIKQTQKEIQEGICPRCGGLLVQREGQFGSFLGCSNYPKCRFILNSNNYNER